MNAKSKRATEIYRTLGGRRRRKEGGKEGKREGREKNKKEKAMEEWGRRSRRKECRSKYKTRIFEEMGPFPPPSSMVHLCFSLLGHIRTTPSTV